MREIITLQIGNCGNQVGRKFWQALHHEHGLDDKSHIPSTIPTPTTTSPLLPSEEASSAATPPTSETTDLQPPSTTTATTTTNYDNKMIQYNNDLYRGLNTFYDEGANGQYVPRAIFADLDQSSLDSIQCDQQCGKWFRPDYLQSTGLGGSGNNWAKGYYTEGPDLAEIVMDIIRKSSESCDSLQGFQLFHSIGGGCGSGLGSLLLDKLRDEYCGKIQMTNSLFPSPKSVDSVLLAPYNSILTLSHLIENCQMVNCFDNFALSQLYRHKEDSTFSDWNSLIAQSISGITSSFRFPTMMNSDLRKMATNLVPFPRAHFFMNSLAPVKTNESLNEFNAIEKVERITSELFSPSHFLIDTNPKNGVYLTASVVFRGSDVSSSSAEEQVSKMIHRESFYKSIPNNLQTSICKVGESKCSGTLIANSTSISTVLRQLSNSFSMLFKRKAFMKSFEIEGMDEMEFSEAHSNVVDLISEYEMLQIATTDDTVEATTATMDDDVEVEEEK